MKRIRWEIGILLSLMLWAGACSSSKPRDEGEADAVPSADAMTDAAPAPSGDNAPPAPAPVNTSDASMGGGGSGSYTVQTGDTLMKIAFETLGDLYKWKEIYETNKDKIKDPNFIPKGMVLNYNNAGSVNIDKNGEKYLIKKGDTLGTISTEVYGSKTRWKELWENNKQLIHDPNRIFAGFYLYYLADANKAAQGDSSAAPVASASPDSSTPAPKKARSVKAKSMKAKAMKPIATKAAAAAPAGAPPLPPADDGSAPPSL